VKAHLERIEQIDPKLNSFITVTAEAALQRATQADQERQGAETQNPLNGLPLAIKDLYETKGVRTTAGSTFFADYYPTEDGVAVQKLVQAGGVLLKLLHELPWRNDVNHYGACRNPGLIPHLRRVFRRLGSRVGCRFVHGIAGD
jgi:aspartyl-tRNA(Asn)/glutamyl-tRNA(Gln) amidotransferase subunit A